MAFCISGSQPLNCLISGLFGFLDSSCDQIQLVTAANFDFLSFEELIYFLPINIPASQDLFHRLPSILGGWAVDPFYL